MRRSTEGGLGFGAAFGFGLTLGLAVGLLLALAESTVVAGDFGVADCVELAPLGTLTFAEAPAESFRWVWVAGAVLTIVLALGGVGGTTSFVVATVGWTALCRDGPLSFVFTRS